MWNVIWKKTNKETYTEKHILQDSQPIFARLIYFLLVSSPNTWCAEDKPFIANLSKVSVLFILQLYDLGSVCYIPEKKRDISQTFTTKVDNEDIYTVWGITLYLRGWKLRVYRQR